MKLLFLGGTSYLGSKIIERLERNSAHEITLIKRDTSDSEIAAISEQDFVFNLVVDYGKNKSLAEVLSVNVEYPLRITEKLKFKTIINFSTALEKNVSHYSFSKKVLEESLVFLSNQKKYNVLNLHLQHFYGKGAPPYNFITFLTNKMMKSEEIDLTDCSQKRDFIHIDDVIDAIELILIKSKQFKQVDVIDIGSGEAGKLKDIVEEIKKITGSTSKLNFGAVAKRLGEPQELIADISRLKAMGWNPKISLNEGISRLTDSID
jgi:CDP-paratose synthetase